MDALVRELQELYLAQQQREEEAEEAAAAAQAEEDMVKRAPFSSWAGKDNSLLDINLVRAVSLFFDVTLLLLLLFDMLLLAVIVAVIYASAVFPL